MATQADMRTGAVAAVFAALCWGLATVMSKAALAAVSPVLLLVLQLGASVAILWSIVWVCRIPLVNVSQISRFAWLGLLEPGLAYLLGLIGLTDMNAGVATLIQSTEAIMIVIVSAILLRQRPTGRFLWLSILALFGLLAALGLSDRNGPTGNGAFGSVLMICGTATAAIYVVLSSRIAMECNAIVIVAWQQSMALILALLALPFESLYGPQGLAPPATGELWLTVILSGIIQYALAFSLYMWALKSIAANTAGCFLNLTPVFGLVGGSIFLRESFSILQVAGALTTIASVIAISRNEQHSS
jgi:drug/metabolite transporter (DMT)-like permease